MAAPSSRARSNSGGFNTALRRAISPSARRAPAGSGFSVSRSSSPTRVAVRFSLDNRGLSIAGAGAKPIAGSPRRKSCMCSPTSHPGSFRCSLHKGARGRQQSSISPSSNRLNARRSAMTNSLVRIGTVEGDLVKRALAALIRPCAHQQRRRGAFERRPSRLSVVCNAAGAGFRGHDLVMFFSGCFRRRMKEYVTKQNALRMTIAHSCDCV